MSDYIPILSFLDTKPVRKEGRYGDLILIIILKKKKLRQLVDVILEIIQNEIDAHRKTLDTER